MKIRWIILLSIAVVLCAAFVVSWNHRSVGSRPHHIVATVFAASTKPESKTPVDPGLVKALNEFSFKLFAELATGREGENAFVCPPSMAMSLSMVYNGARGETKKTMADALQVQGLSVDDLNKAYSALLENLNAPGPGVQVQIANGIWGDSGCTFRPDFIDACKTGYGADVYAADLSSRATVNRVNRWVRDKTRGRIDSIVDRFDPQAIMSLVNAVYFDGAWDCPFEKSETKQGKFTLADGKQVGVPMMSAFRGECYLYEAGFKAMNLSYKGGRYSMYVFVPNISSGLPDFLAGLNQNDWTKWLASFHNGNAIVSLPRFQLNCEMKDEMKSALSSLGMGNAFDPDRADFGGLSDTHSWIGEVVQKTGLTVNEKGTIAVAASRSDFCACADEMEVIARRPFFCAIVDNKTGLILFMGTVYDPTKS